MKKSAGFEIAAWAKRQELPRTMKSVLIAVASYADAKGAAWPSQRTLAADIGVTDRAVRDALAKLEHFGVLKRMRRQKRGSGAGGRSSDLILLSIDGEFKVANSDLKKVAGLAEPASSKSKWGYRKRAPRLPEAGSGDRTTSELPDISLSSRVTDIREVIPVISEGGVLVEIPAGRVLH